MGSWVCLPSGVGSVTVSGALPRRALSALLLQNPISLLPSYQFHHNRRRVCASASSGAKELQQQQYLRSPDLVGLEYADLNLTHKFLRCLWKYLIGIKSSGTQHCHSWWILDVLVKRAEFWVKDLALSNIYFMFANATTSFQQLVSTYPGPLMLVSILCPDPYFKKRHHKRRVVQKPLVDSIASNLMPSGQVFIQSDVLEVALDMRNQFGSQPQVLKHIHEIDSSVLCDSEGWVLSNPMGIRTEREIHAEFEGDLEAICQCLLKISAMLMLRLKISAKVCPLLHSITTVSFSTSASASASPSISTVDLLDSYTVTPPIQPWPRRLHPKHLISLITREPNLDLALQIFHHASKFHPGFSHNYHTYHAILNRLSRSRAFHPKIDPLLSDLSNSGIKCSEDLFITLIRNFGVLGRPKLSFKTFLDIPKFGAQRSAKSLNALLNALVQNHEYGLVHSVFKNCGQRFGVRPNVFTCNILIKALCQKGDVETALKVLDEMPAMGFVPDVVTYTTVLGGYVLRGDMVGAKRVFGEVLDRGWHPDATTYTILMDGFVKQGKLVDAVKVMDEMEENKVGPNEVTYGVMIEAYCKAKKSGEAVNLLNDMLEKRYIPSSALCCKVIDILCHEGKAEDGCELWKRLLKNNCTPDNAISSTVIYWLCKEGKVWEAKKLFNQFKTDLIPSVMTYNMLISGLCEVGELCEAGRLWDDMVEKGCAPNAFTYNMLIKGFCKIGKAEEGIRILEEMLDKGCLPNKSTYGMLIEGLCDLGKEAEVTKVISLAMSNGDIESASWDLLLTKFVGDLDTGGAVMDKILVENVN
ncbi:unnamed protein product [Prunus armeniaca]|uniref:tRNA (guanine(46)-N(7))-methyltransferase n=2 Tax=Prunus armeniaca TaxID=36596 RepID=A0A6J5WHU7_PRUAR|nr:unnamed protein product [Prunus armeniaca]